jgi:sugar lactone lactonase YvrE
MRHSFRWLALLGLVLVGFSGGAMGSASAASPGLAAAKDSLAYPRPAGTAAGVATNFPGNHGKTPSPPGAGAACAPNCTPPLVNHGGLLQVNPTIYLIFWGPAWNATTGNATAKQLEAAEAKMIGSLNGTRYAAILQQYLGANNATITLGGSWQDQAVPPATVNRAAVATEVANAISNNPGWVTGNNSQFMVFTQSGANIPSFFETEQAPDVCAYHDHAISPVPEQGQLIFDLEPWISDQAFQQLKCLSYSPGNNFIDAETALSTHEIAEAATDPIWDTNQGWTTNDRKLYEIGDLCNYAAVSAPPVVGEVQLLWDNVSSTCTSAAGVPGPAIAAAGFTSSLYATGFASSNSTNGVGPVGVVLDSSGVLYVADNADGELYTVPAGGGVATPLAQDQLFGLAESSSGRLYGATLGGTIYEVDKTTGALIRDVVNVGSAEGIGFDPLSGDLFVDATANNEIIRVSHLEDGQPVTTSVYATGAPLDGIDFGSDGKLYAANTGAGIVYSVSGTNQPPPHNLVVAAQLPVPDGTAVGGTGGSQFLAVNENNGNIMMVNLATGAQSLIASGGTRGDFVTVGSDGCLYATQSASIQRVTVSDGTCDF